MTVRQLESMIRLSEGLARLHCDEEVKPKYVQEAFRLLQSSVIHVQSDEVVLGDLEVDSQPIPRMTSDMEGSAMDIETQPINVESQPSQMKMKYETFMRINNMLVFQLRRHESEEDSGMLKNDLIQWYLETIEEEIETEEDLLFKRREVKAVIDRLVHKDGVLLELKQDNSDNPSIVVHPNYILKE